MQNLDGHAFADFDVLGFIDAAHPAFAAHAFDLIAAGQERPDHARTFFQGLGRHRRFDLFSMSKWSRCDVLTLSLVGGGRLNHRRVRAAGAIEQRYPFANHLRALGTLFDHRVAEQVT